MRAAPVYSFIHGSQLVTRHAAKRGTRQSERFPRLYKQGFLAVHAPLPGWMGGEVENPGNEVAGVNRSTNKVPGRRMGGTFALYKSENDENVKRIETLEFLSEFGYLS